MQENHLDENCVIDSQIGESLKSTDVVKDLSVRLDKTFQSWKLIESTNVPLNLLVAAAFQLWTAWNVATTNKFMGNMF